MNFTRVGERTPTKSDFTSSVKQANTGVPGVKFNVCILLSSAFFFLQLVDFLLFTVISLLLSTMLIVCYSMAVHTAFTGEEIGSFSWYSYNNYPNQNTLRAKIFTVLVLILGCLEFLLCIASIGYFAYSYKRDHGKVSSEIGFQIYA